jgi:hypothetical protein
VSERPWKRTEREGAREAGSVLPLVEVVDALDTDALVDFLTQGGALMARARARLALSATTMQAPATTVAPNGRGSDDFVTDVAEVAHIVRRSPSWVRKRGHTLPGFRQPGGRGTRVAWSRVALEAWTTAPASVTCLAP